jgi:hypothetical protein
MNPPAANQNSKSKVMVLVGTRKGGYVFTSDTARQSWQASDLRFKGWQVMHMVQDPRDQRLHAAIANDVYGATTHYSDDFGEHWTQARVVPAFDRPSRSPRPLGNPGEAQDPAAAQNKKEEVRKVWHIEPGRASEPGVLYAGIEPACLFKSTDSGESWSVNDALYDHPHRAQWFPGAGGLCLHTILLDPLNEQRMYIAISAGGCYRSDDGGLSWSPRNKNVRADFSPDKSPEFGQCVHKMAMHPDRPDVLYQQNHCGIYRSDNAGDDWIDIGEGKLPSRFGFPIAVHPHDPKTVYIVPEESDEFRVSINGRFAIWRSRDGGESWQPTTNGLPQHASMVALRESMATDTLDQPAVYVGTSTGQIFYSRNDGSSWEVLADYLPPILSIETVVV